MSCERAPERRADALIGEVLASRYLIEHKLGEGAMGAVYKARHVKVGRAFAVKVLHARLLEEPKVALRFEREAELAGRLRHPNVVGVVDVGETPSGLRYMVMDFAEGSDLATLLDEAPMPPARIIPLVRQMLEGLYHAHEAGLIHRDFKPENVIIEEDDHGTEVPRIVDFGISILREGGDSSDAAGRLTTNGLVLGTPHYMAPEQAVADPIDHRIDLFAMGIVIYEMLSGKLPFDGNGAEVARANLLLDPPPIAERVEFLEVDPLLEAFARRLMAKKRDHRPATAKLARELLDLIERDRVAAAVALGVPVAVSVRPPAITQSVPATPHELRTTPATPLAVGAVTPRASEILVQTAPAEPLPWGTGAAPAVARGKRGLVIGGLVGLAAVGVIAALALGGDGTQAKPPEPIAVAAPAVRAEPPPPQPQQPGDVQPQPQQPPVAIDIEPPPVKKPIKPGPGSARPVTKIEPTKIEPTKLEPAKIEPTKLEPAILPPPPVATGSSVNDVQLRWQQVGNRVTALKTAPRTKEVGDQLFTRWRHMKLYDATATETSRKAALIELAEIDRLAAAAAKP